MKEQLDHLEREIKELRIEYEKYFAGVERFEPVKRRATIKKQLRRLQTQGSYNTALKFRIHSLIQSLVTHEQYWNRITRQIEEGTFKRDKLKAQKMMRERSESAGTPPTARAAPRSAEPKHDAALTSLHQQYAAARQQLGLASIPIDSLAKTVAKQTAAIKERFKCERVEFKVAVKNGKAILKAVPK